MHTTTYTDTEATEVLTAEGIPAETIEVYIGQLTEVGLEIEDQPDTGLVLTADELDTIREAVAEARGADAEAAAEYDLVEVTDDHADYDAAEIGKLALQRNGEHLDFVTGEGVAAEMVTRQIGAPVKAVPATNYYAGARWAFQLV